ncbi:hypothetical protein ABH966_004984 [Lysinibacillus sp. RC46]|uniref:hypothetical protein n=1 Tax=unclassified Lysinibacillus TaxID=2636778 RepID=UPI0035164062
MYMYFCANLTPSLFYDEGYLFWKMNVDKFENMGDKFTMLGDKLKKLGDKFTMLGDKLKMLAGSSQC